MSYQSLDDWLAWQTTLHAREIELGLDRIETVARRLNLLDCPFKVITVAGTNGKGSSVAMLSAILDCAGFKVGTYTSPHILKYNERIKISLQCVDDQELCASFARIDHAREGISLSFFEFATLAALDIFHRQQVDVAILEDLGVAVASLQKGPRASRPFPTTAWLAVCWGPGSSALWVAEEPLVGLEAILSPRISPPMGDEFSF